MSKDADNVNEVTLRLGVLILYRHLCVGVCHGNNVMGVVVD